MKPRILITHTLRWPNAARMAIAFRRADCHVHALCRSDHPLLKIKGVECIHNHNHFRPLNSLIRAIQESKPHLIVPCDDRAVAQLHQLYENSGGADAHREPIRAAIERSLGRPSSYPLLAARSQLETIAQTTGVLLPASGVLRDAKQLKQWLSTHGFPAVLKVDGTWGGQWVTIVKNEREATTAFERLSARQSTTRAVMRLVAKQDPELLVKRWAGTRPVVTIQSFIRGTVANCAVACWKGQVLAGIAVEVVETQSELGHATVVRIQDDPQMLDVAKKIVKGLGVSGFCGFDFILEETTGKAYLLEINPRVTQLNHMALGPGRDMVAALCAQVTGGAVKCAPAVTQCQLIALFPHFRTPTTSSGAAPNFFADVPHEEPALIKAFSKPPSLTSRLTRQAVSLRW